MPPDFYLRTRCRMCDSSRLVGAMSLTATPPGNRLLKKAELVSPETRYPLELNFCESCTHVQLAHVVDPRILYQRDYLYVSGTSAEFVRHLRDYASEMVRRFALVPGSYVADIGSNDGTCLSFFKDLGMKVLGVDPATSIAEAATSAGVETVPGFFSLCLARELRARYGPASFITSHNACAHIDELDDVMRGVEHWLKDDGVFVLEVGYFVDVYRGLFFDTIYHEHLDYHTVSPFRNLFARTGMEMISVERIKPQGGSIRVTAQKVGGKRIPDSSVDDLIQLERSMGLHLALTLTAFGDHIAHLGHKLRELMGSLKAAGRSIAAYGAPTKAVTFLSHFRIGAESLDFVVEDNTLKHGLYLPLSHVPVVPTSQLYERRPDFVLILAWNFAASIMAMHEQYVTDGGRFIIPMPEPMIV